MKKTLRQLATDYRKAHPRPPLPGAEEPRCALFQLDDRYRCIELELRPDRARLLAAAPDLEAALKEVEAGFEHELTPAQVETLRREPDLAALRPDRATFIQRLSAHSALPYELHTGRELRLMIESGKPFAHFLRPSAAQFEDFCEQPFFEYVASGRLRHQVVDVDVAGDDEEHKVVWDVFTQPGEEWRVETFRLLRHCLKSGLWAQEMEYIEGALLGYTEEQNAIFLAFKGIL